jgi:hypothetical protein
MHWGILDQPFRHGEMKKGDGLTRLTRTVAFSSASLTMG